MANAPHATRLLLPGKVRILTADTPPLAAMLHRTESISFEVTHRYGLTETAVLVVGCAWKREWNKLPTLEHARLKARQGVRTPGMAVVDIVDGETGCNVPRDGSTMGEIVLRGRLRHARLPQRREGHQGMIISGGENISRVEVGSVLYNHQAMNEAGRVLGRDVVRVRETQRRGWGQGPCRAAKDLHQEDPEVRAPEPCQGDGANPQGRQQQQQQVVVLVLCRRLAWHGHVDMDMFCSAAALPLQHGVGRHLFS